MNESSFTEDIGKAQTKGGLHRLRRYSHNRITQSVEVMGGMMLNGGNRRTTYFVLSILLVSSLPMLSTVSADVGTPSELQAQDISVTFDNVSETTTITEEYRRYCRRLKSLFRTLGCYLPSLQA